MKDWIKELCPEIADWQAELIAEHCQPKREWVELNCPICGEMAIPQPPKREPLTDDEIDTLLLKHGVMNQWPTQKQVHEFARAIEAKLKEKNGL